MDEKINDLEREVERISNDFQQLEQLFHTMRETLEVQIEVLTDEIKNETRKA